MFVDIDPDTFNLSPKELEKAIAAYKLCIDSKTEDAIREKAAMESEFLENLIEIWETEKDYWQGWQDFLRKKQVICIPGLNNKFMRIISRWAPDSLLYAFSRAALKQVDLLKK